ncbi:MAG TPA: hypothetical protein PLE00_08855, partial [Anaerolineaceae bacterium]|nr:hypothetical protein [Anaerolineaceae bacterium]
DPRSGARGLSRGSTQIAPCEASQNAGNGASVRLSKRGLFRLKLAGGFRRIQPGRFTLSLLHWRLMTAYSSCVIATNSKV